MPLDVDNLPSSIEENHQIVRELYDEVQRLEELNRLLRKNLYGASSEKLPADPPEQLMLLEEEVHEFEESVTQEEAPKRKKRKGGGRRKLPASLPRKRVEHDMPLEQRTCCGHEMRRIGEDIRERLCVIPAQFYVEEHVYPKFSCAHCQGVEGDGPTVVQAKAPPQLIPRSMTTPSLLSYLFYSKFVEGLPFYRLEKRFALHGIKLTRNNMAGWAIKSMDAILPLYNLIAEMIREQLFIGIDETTFQVLKEPEKRAQSKSYMWVFRAEREGRPLIYYQYDPTRSHKVPEAFLEGYKGTVQSDGYSGYSFLDKIEEIRHIVCWAHARRKFMDVLNAKGSKNKRGHAGIAIKFIRDLYRVEKEAREQDLSPERVVALRQQKAKPILESFQKWLDNISPKTPPKRLMGKAISYTLKNWSRLTGYLEDGNAKIDNNLVENSIRPFVIGRKNFLFADSVNGANAVAVFYTMVETAKAHELNPEHYLNYIFTHLPAAETVEQIEALLPWSVTPEQILPEHLAQALAE